MIRTFSTTAGGWQAELDALLERKQVTPLEIEQRVSAIIADVKARGDAALFEYTERFDGYRPASLVIDEAEIAAAAAQVDPSLLEALVTAAKRIEDFHRRQIEETWTYEGEHGVLLGQKITPLDRVGVYVPGGRNAFPSTVLMDVIPARLAGVPEIVMVTPTPGGQVEPVLLAAAHIAGVRRIYRLGGAQAVAALAFGTASVPKVDKVIGPGNIYVATAKRLLLGTIGIDSIAGPSEIMVVADSGAEPRIVAVDLLSQAEHDPEASAMLVTPDAAFAEQVAAALAEEAAKLPRAAVVTRSLVEHGAIIVTRDLTEAFEVVNRVAPEHLELMLKDARSHLDRVRNAGAIFLGYQTPEAIGDYVAGPNHTLPTGSTARFYSPLGVYDFVKRSSIIEFNQTALKALGEQAITLARSEELEAHARSVEYRLRAE
ncbi:MAG: Histidinol dehydrogenase [Deltaproteobacteria bacterium ADurb.Bin510]|nr:MAG: Histidinol dehydrogenase [Deltaproteobacteria bacterium ADurb.Bin510]